MDRPKCRIHTCYIRSTNMKLYLLQNFFKFCILYIYYYIYVNIKICVFIVYHSGRKGAQLADCFQNNQMPVPSSKKQQWFSTKSSPLLSVSPHLAKANYFKKKCLDSFILGDLNHNMFRWFSGLGIHRLLLMFDWQKQDPLYRTDKQGAALVPEAVWCTVD